MEEGFKKIEFNDSPASQADESRVENNTNSQQGFIKPMKKIRFPKIKFGKKKLGIAGVVILVLVLVAAFLGFKAYAIYNKSQVVYAQAKKVADAARAQNIVIAKDELLKTKEDAEALRREIGSISVFKYVPFFGLYISDADHMIGAGIHGINAAIITADSLIPYADVLGLQGEGSFSGGSAEDRIRIAVKSLDKVVPRIDDIEVEVKSAQAEIANVDTGRYPNFGPFTKVREQITQAKYFVNEGALAVEQGKPLIKVLPELLGANKAKKYLILFQNDGELRPTGGFLTFFSIFRIEEGVIHIDRSDDIYRLDDAIASHPPAPDIILNYLPQVNEFYIRDSNLSPDFQKSMTTFRDFYESSSVATDIDGIIAIDTDFLVHVISILGEVEAGGQKFTAEHDETCNCPQVVYQLQLNTTKPVGYVREDRKAIVGALLYATMDKAMRSSPTQYWGPLFQQAIIDANEKHIMFSLNNNDAQKGIRALGWAGEIKNFEGDYLHINDANFAGGKSNIFIKSNARMDYDIADDGSITKTVKIEYRNPEPHSDCNLESGGLCLSAVLRDFQRLYVPEGATLIDVKGSEVEVEAKKDLGKTYFESFFRVNPQGKSEITYTYKLPFKVEGDVLPVLIQKQPGVEVVPFEVYLNGEKVDEFDLRGDHILNLEV